MRTRRLKVSGATAIYHVMTRTVNGMHLFKDRDKEILRRMIWQVADFCGVEVLTYCIMANHFHVLLRVPEVGAISDQELLRRYKVLYPKPTKYQTASIAVIEGKLAAGGEEAQALRQQLMARMGDVSEYMKTVKQRFSVYYNRSHDRFGTLWAERFKSVLVEGRGNPLQTMAAYIDLNPVRASLVKDAKDYRFCGYAEALGGHLWARHGLRKVWADHLGATQTPEAKSLEAHRELMFGGRLHDPGLPEPDRERLVKALQEGKVQLPMHAVLRCRVRYFTDGAILGSTEYVRSFVAIWQMEKGRKYPPKVSRLRGADWQDMACIQGLRKAVFS